MFDRIILRTTTAVLGALVTRSGCAEQDCSPAANLPAGCTINTCVLDDAEFSIREYIIEDAVSTEKRGGWNSVGPCNCAWIPCGERAVCTPPQLSHSQQHQICWSVGGSISIEGKTGLVIGLLAELSATQAFTGQFQHCYTWSTTYTFTLQQGHCFTHFTRETWVETRTCGKVIETPNRYHWVQYELDGTEKDMGWTTCGGGVSEGDATLIDGRGIEHAPFPERCGGQAPSPDIYNGKRAEPCCSPLPTCDEMEPGENPCCGCWAND